MPNLYKIDQKYREITDELINNGGELTPEIEQALATVATDLNVAAANFALMTLEMDAQSDTLDREIKRLQEYKKSVNGASARIKEQIKAAMERRGITKIESELVRIGFRKSEETVIDDENAVPDLYKDAKTTYTINKADVKSVIKSGQDVPGARVVTKQNLNIK